MFHLIRKSKQTFYAFGSNIIYTFAIWFTAIVINYYFGAETLGEYSFVQAIISPLALFFHLQLKVLATLELEIKDKFSEYISVYILSEGVFLGLVIILGLISNQSLLFYSFALLKVVESLNMLIQGYHQSSNNFYNAFVISFIRSLILLITLWIVFNNGYSISVSFLIVSFIWLLVFLFFDYSKIKRENVYIKLISSYKRLKPLIFSGASLSIVTSLDTLTAAIPRYFIKGYFSDIELGKFTMVLQFFVASTIFVISVGHPFLVKLKLLVEKNDIKGFIVEVKKTVLIFLFFSIIVILFFTFSSNFIMKIFWGKEYEYLGKYLTISMIGIIPLFMSSVFVYAINGLKFYSIHMKYYPIIILSSIILAFYLIPLYGLLGGVITIVMTQIIRTFLSGIALNYCIKKIKSDD